MNDLPALLDAYDIARSGVVHVGAHRGQEVPIYRTAGFERIVLVEPEPDLAARLSNKFGESVEVVEKVCVSTKAKTRQFNVASQRKWSSLLDVPADQSRTGETIEVRQRIKVAACRVADIQDGCNVLVVDTQGTERDVLEGADLDAFDLVIVETVEPSDVFRPAWERPDADAWFAERGWQVAHEFTHTAPDVLDVAYRPTPQPADEPAGDDTDEPADSEA